MFDATSHKFNDVSFERVNVADPSNGDICSKYEIRSIPHLVFLDSSNTVLYNGGASSQPGDFDAMVQQYH